MPKLLLIAKPSRYKRRNDIRAIKPGSRNVRIFIPRHPFVHSMVVGLEPWSSVGPVSPLIDPESHGTAEEYLRRVLL